MRILPCLVPMQATSSTVAFEQTCHKRMQEALSAPVVPLAQHPDAAETEEQAQARERTINYKPETSRARGLLAASLTVAAGVVTLVLLLAS